jgi:hypothetical protein
MIFSGEFDGVDSDDDDDSDSGSDFTMITQEGESLCIPALGYLKKCNNILQTMWKMPACPVFNGANRLVNYQFSVKYCLQFTEVVCSTLNYKNEKQKIPYGQNS